MAQLQRISIKERVLAHWDLLNRLASRRFNKEGVAEAAALYVMEQLAENDWQRVRQFSGRSRFVSYLSSVVYRLLEDYSRKHFGRKKVPGWVSKMGGIWIILFRLLCFERFPFNDAVLIAADRRKDLQNEKIEQVAEKILGEIPDCGQDQYKEILYEEEAYNGAEREAVSVQQKNIEQKQKVQLEGALFQELLGVDRSKASEAAVRSVLKKSIDISVEERLLLKLCYQDGFSIAEAGRRAGLNRYQAHGKMRRLYARIRQAFNKAGCEDDILLLLGE